jgi:hypothetical protein
MKIFMLVIVFVAICRGPASEAYAAQTLDQAKSGKGYFVIDFSGYPGGSVAKWLEARGFKFEKDAKNQKLLELLVKKGSRAVVCSYPTAPILSASFCARMSR